MKLLLTGPLQPVLRHPIGGSPPPPRQLLGAPAQRKSSKLVHLRYHRRVVSHALRAKLPLEHEVGCTIYCSNIYNKQQHWQQETAMPCHAMPAAAWLGALHAHGQPLGAHNETLSAKGTRVTFLCVFSASWSRLSVQ